jgi:hypothetical protein
MTILAEPKPFLEPHICGEWLALTGLFLFAERFGSRFGQETHFGYEHFTVRARHLY